MEAKPDHLTFNLDEEFKAGLNTLRPFILRLSSVEDAKLTRLWLEKLHEAVDERKLRNIFLRELTDQVQSGKLRFPFNKPPPLSPLYLCQRHERHIHVNHLPHPGDLQYGEILTPITTFDKDGGGERYSSTDSYSGSSRYFNPRGDAPPVLDKRKLIVDPPNTPESTVSIQDEHLSWRGAGVGRPRFFGKKGSHMLTARRPRRSSRPLESSKSKDNPQEVRALLSTISSLQMRNDALAQEIKLYQETATKTQKNLDSVQQEVAILKNKLEEMRAINFCIEESNANVVNDYRKVMTESVKRLSDRLDVFSKRNLTLEEKLEKLKRAKKCYWPDGFEVNELRLKVKKLNKELDTEKKERAAETQALRKQLAQKEQQLAKVDSHVQHQCDKMQKEVISMKQEIDRNPNAVYLTPKFKEKISGLRKHVHHVEKTNKKILGVFEKKVNQYKVECDRKINYWQSQVECKDRLATNLQVALKKAEAQYRKHISELQESCRAQRTFDHQRIASLEERLRQRLFE